VCSSDLDFNISQADLKARLDRGEACVLLDVREPQEHQIARLPGSVFIPLGELVARQGELDPDAEIVVYCHHGVRSASATAYLRSAGFPRARNLVGGIDSWSLKIDPTMARY
jgi:adenylyltransferase/sulfurtransferase